MELDMFLYRINRKANTEDELNLINKSIQISDENELGKLEEVVGFIRNNDNEAYIKSNYKMFIDEFIKAYMSVKDKTKDEIDNEMYDENNEIVYIYNSLTAKEVINCVEKEKEQDVKLYEYITNNKDIINNIRVDDIGYWRKHPDLHKIMEDKYYEKGGEGTFNCKALILSKEEIENIIKLADDIISGKVESEKATGFFWGESIEDDWIDTKEIFEKALKETDFDNETIYYDSWW